MQRSCELHNDVMPSRRNGARQHKVAHANTNMEENKTGGRLATAIHQSSSRVLRSQPPHPTKKKKEKTHTKIRPKKKGEGRRFSYACRVITLDLTMTHHYDSSL